MLTSLPLHIAQDTVPSPHLQKPAPSVTLNFLHLKLFSWFLPCIYKHVSIHLALKASQPAIELPTTSHCPSSYSGHNKTLLWMCPVLSWLQAFTQTVKSSFPIINIIRPRTFYNSAKQIGSLLPLFL